jgi:hypothetical protein
MLKIFAAILLAASAYAELASAHGGGPAESMPATNFTDMPDYRPKPVAPCLLVKHVCKHVHWRQNSSHGN